MPLELSWIANRSASCFHAAAACARGQSLTVPEVSAALAEPAQRIAAICREFNMETDRYFDHLVPQSSISESPRHLAQITLTKTCGHAVAEQVAPRMAATLAELKQAYTAACPTLLDELELRSGPLRELWEARGPGLLAAVARRTESAMLVERADVLVVQPVLGGGGAAHLPYNSVRIEAVLANPSAELPEVVRLGWLLSQLNLDLPRYSEDLSRDRTASVIAWATLPAVLAAAADVELVRDEASALATAVEVWNLAQPPVAPWANLLASWWQTYLAGRPPLRVALLALDKMIASGPANA